MVGGHSRSTSSASTSSPDDLTAKLAGTDPLASRFPFNVNMPLEYDPAAAMAPEAGQSEGPRDARAISSTVTEKGASEKVGSGAPTIGSNRTIGPLNRVRVDSTARVLTTNQGVSVRKPDPGLLIHQPGGGVSTAKAFIAALAKRRHFDRETDPPLF